MKGYLAVADFKGFFVIWRVIISYVDAYLAVMWRAFSDVEGCSVIWRDFSSNFEGV